MAWRIPLLRRYFEFSGRSRRKEYWMFVLFTILANVALGIVESVLGLKLAGKTGVGVLSGPFALGDFILSLSLAVRRLHDIGRTGW